MRTFAALQNHGSLWHTKLTRHRRSVMSAFPGPNQTGHASPCGLIFFGPVKQFDQQSRAGRSWSDLTSLDSGCEVLGDVGSIVSNALEDI